MMVIQGGTMQYAASPTLADALFPRFATNSRGAMWLRELAMIGGFVILVALLAQVQLRVPWTTVPITGQTFGVLVAGGALGMRRGVACLSMYALIGMFLLPVFTPANTATSGAWDLHFILPWRGNEAYLWDITSGGYIVGFILAAGLVGFLAERGIDRGPWVQLGMLAGSALIYLPGLLWLGYLIGTDWVAPGASRPVSDLISGSGTLDKTLKGGLYPFIVGDLMKLIAAAMVLPAAWALVDRLKGRED
jgi:biotin transporter BioY